MAQRFTIINLKKNSEPRCYIAEIEFNGRMGRYSIASNANIQYLDWIDTLQILNGQDMPFNGEKPSLQIRGLNAESRVNEKGLEKAFYEFIDTECSEKT